MSGIFGIVRFDDREVDRRAMDRMAKSMAHRGPDGVRIDVAGNVGVGACLSFLRASDINDLQPIYDSGGDITLVADSRLDERNRLGELVGVPHDAQETTPDSDLILANYKKSGESVINELIGDFTFCLWDGKRRKLILARDHMGQRQLFYHANSNFIAFATEIKALWAVADVPRELDRDAIGRRLLGDFAAEDNLFKGVETLPGGAILVLDREGKAQLRRYWIPRAAAKHIGQDERYYIAAYREVLEEAVACRLRDLKQPPGLLFSGGFDSGGIAALAELPLAGRHKLIAATSVMPAHYNGTIRHARRWAQLCATKMPWLQVLHVTREGIDALTDFDVEVGSSQLPRSSYSFVNDALLKELSRSGVRLAMDGHGGDYTLNPRGIGALARTLKKGNFKRFYREFRAYRRVNHRTVYSVLRYQLAPYFVPPVIEKAWQALTKKSMIRPINHDLAVDLEARGLLRTGGYLEGSSIDTSMSAQIADMLHKVAMHGSETSSWARQGLTLTRPFHDKRVVELALAIPESLYIRNGYNRYLARCALKFALPAEFQSRSPMNDDEIPDFQRMVSSLKPVLLHDISRMEQSEAMSRTFNFAAIRELLGRRGPDDHESGWEQDTHLAMTGYMFARYTEWFDRENSTPSGSDEKF